MSDIPRKILCEIIDHHGITLCNDTDHFETVLRKKCKGQYKREVFMLTYALRENIVLDLLNASKDDTQTTLWHLTQRLYDHLGFDKTLATWAVQSWDMALNKTTDDLQEPTTSDELEFTQEFSKAYDLMEKSHQCLFITGKAGTGKSTLLQYFQQKTDKKSVVLAPTGIAALNIGGATLHSFFRLPPRPIHPSEVKRVSRKRRKLYQSLDTIIIDEISMVRADMMDVIDRFMRLNGKDQFQPFGGTQMIFIGDLFQLPPVVSSGEEEKLFTTTYQSPFFFSAKIFNELSLEFIELTKVFRHKEQEFIYLLNSIRNNQACIKEIEQINQR